METLVASYIILAESLRKVGLINSEWVPEIPKDAGPDDRELVDLFIKIQRQARTLNRNNLSKISNRVTEAINHLPEGEHYGNLHLTGVYLANFWAYDEIGPLPMLLRSKTDRIIDFIRREIVRQGGGAEISRQSYRIADNLSRYLKGKPILDNALREKWNRRWIKSRAKTETKA